MHKEAKARIKINALLNKSGWRFFDDESGPANIQLEVNVKIKKKSIDEMGEDFEKTANGYADYLLLDVKGFPCTGRYLRVIMNINVKPCMVITLFFDRRLRRTS